MPRHRVGAKRRPVTGSSGGIQYSTSLGNNIGLAEYWIIRFPAFAKASADWHLSPAKPPA
jgi:hypothetical protein